MKLKIFLIGVLFCVGFLSCSYFNNQIKFRQLRNDVLLHYKNDKDPLKEKAAIFLLDNMKERYSIVGERYEGYATIIKKCNPNPDTVHAKLLLVRNLQLEDKTVKDVSVLTPEYLIDNIDRAFEAWDKAGWKDQISFDNFCEYILPYRTGNEPLENWRNEVLKDTLFKIAGDTLGIFNNLEDAALWFTRKQDKLKRKFQIKFGSNAAGIPDMQFSVLKLLNTGTCDNLSKYSIFACRTASIPIAIDFIPHWGNLCVKPYMVSNNYKTGDIAV